MVYKSTKIIRMKGDHRQEEEDVLISEQPLTIYLNDKEIVTLLCTPQHLEELAVGFLISEGLLAGEAQVSIDREKGLAFVTGTENKLMGQTFLKRFITTGCGKGTSFYHFGDIRNKKIGSEVKIPARNLLELMKEMQQHSELYRMTGCVHSAALCTPEMPLVFREDIGRHNAVDKIVGRCRLDGVDIADKLLLTSGRLSSEIVLKVAKIGVPVLASRSAPSDLAVYYAKELGLTLVGFVRGMRMNVYSHAERII
ncbi:formate dehydrogenase accessory sulfurtransferase FdhD [Zhaonella formicivorans]|uniref:formate dehydrogenase accessory sulfurtransferase FdhD n=1 Tax=Zhaonella formicivorans TaxID=2528593 RepID=UPI0010EF4C16|nr:formate dehydrogenase accessory sulfurtransferase FdhD [Zhaonella formicivorans]